MKKELIVVAAILLACALAGAQTGAGNAVTGTRTENQQITNGPVAELVADSSATLGWSMREGSSAMTIKYGSDRDHLNQTKETSPTSEGHNYHANLQGLTPETRYYFQIMQKDEPVGGIGTFRTVASGAPPIKSKAIIPQ